MGMMRLLTGPDAPTSQGSIWAPAFAGESGNFIARVLPPLRAEGGQPFISRRDDRRSGQVTQGRRSASQRSGRSQTDVGGLTCPDRHAAASKRCKAGSDPGSGSDHDFRAIRQALLEQSLLKPRE
ncbi:hypothetical protein DBR21_06405 [Caulobacter sp. HMWF009]|nr:hypothetical protein DBR21_06405 [Caulobacter sp. HMWF009]PTT06031.1 hypothetical protein DBR10_13820 [Caulobacter sp. HMWF025]